MVLDGDFNPATTMKADYAIASKRGQVRLRITAERVTAEDADVDAWIHAAYPNLTPSSHELFPLFVSRVAQTLGMEDLDYEVQYTPPAPLGAGYEVW
jgi:hypothetical protein